jgi:hypothetical protein
MNAFTTPSLSTRASIHSPNGDAYEKNVSVQPVSLTPFSSSKKMYAQYDPPHSIGLLGIVILLFFVTFYVCFWRCVWWPLYITPYAERLKDKIGYDKKWISDRQLKQELNQLRPWLNKHWNVHIYSKSAFSLAFNSQNKTVVRKLYWKRIHSGFSQVYPQIPRINEEIKQRHGKLFLVPTHIVYQTRHLELAEQSRLTGKRYDVNRTCPNKHIFTLAEVTWKRGIRVEDTADRNIVYDRSLHIWWYWDCTDLRLESTLQKVSCVRSWPVIIDKSHEQSAAHLHTIRSALPTTTEAISLVLQWLRTTTTRQQSFYTFNQKKQNFSFLSKTNRKNCKEKIHQQVKQAAMIMNRHWTNEMNEGTHTKKKE